MFDLNWIFVYLHLGLSRLCNNNSRTLEATKWQNSQTKRWLETGEPVKKKKKYLIKMLLSSFFMYLLWFVVDIIRHWLCSKEMMEIDWIFQSGSVLNIWIRNRVHTCTLTSDFYVSDPYLTVFACMKLIKKVSLHFCYLCTFDIFMAKKVILCSIWLF